jgi:hypothetical protein
MKAADWEKFNCLKNAKLQRFERWPFVRKLIANNFPTKDLA